MPLSEDELPHQACLGVAATRFEDLEQVQDRIEDFLREVLPKCRTSLRGLADGTIKKRNEKDLASSLCKWLGAFACEREAIFTFANEEPDKKCRGRTNDMALIPSVGIALLKVGSYYFDPDDHLYVIEAKLLPSPKGRAGEGDRSREYVIGNWAARNSPNKTFSGGIERFKEGRPGQLFLPSSIIPFLILRKVCEFNYLKKRLFKKNLKTQKQNKKTKKKPQKTPPRSKRPFFACGGPKLKREKRKPAENQPSFLLH